MLKLQSRIMFKLFFKGLMMADKKADTVTIPLKDKHYNYDENDKFTTNQHNQIKFTSFFKPYLTEIYKYSKTKANFVLYNHVDEFDKDKKKLDFTNSNGLVAMIHNPEIVNYKHIRLAGEQKRSYLVFDIDCIQYDKIAILFNKNLTNPSFFIFERSPKKNVDTLQVFFEVKEFNPQSKLIKRYYAYLSRLIGADPNYKLSTGVHKNPDFCRFYNREIKFVDTKIQDTSKSKNINYLADKIRASIAYTGYHPDFHKNRNDIDYEKKLKSVGQLCKEYKKLAIKYNMDNAKFYESEIQEYMNYNDRAILFKIENEMSKRTVPKFKAVEKSNVIPAKIEYPPKEIKKKAIVKSVVPMKERLKPTVGKRIAKEDLDNFFIENQAINTFAIQPVKITSTVKAKIKANERMIKETRKGARNVNLFEATRYHVYTSNILLPQDILTIAHNYNSMFKVPLTDIEVKTLALSIHRFMTNKFSKKASKGYTKHDIYTDEQRKRSAEVRKHHARLKIAKAVDQLYHEDKNRNITLPMIRNITKQGYYTLQNDERYIEELKANIKTGADILANFFLSENEQKTLQPYAKNIFDEALEQRKSTAVNGYQNTSAEFINILKIVRNYGKDFDMNQDIAPKLDAIAKRVYLTSTCTSETEKVTIADNAYDEALHAFHAEVEKRNNIIVKRQEEHQQRAKKREYVKEQRRKLRSRHGNILKFVTSDYATIAKVGGIYDVLNETDIVRKKVSEYIKNPHAKQDSETILDAIYKYRSDKPYLKDNQRYKLIVPSKAISEFLAKSK